MKPWTPPAWLRSWQADYDPASSRYANNPAFHQYVAQLLGTSPGAFAALEEQLISTAQLAGITAQGLEFVDDPSWSTLADMTEDLSVYASIIVLAAAAPEALAGLGVIDAGADSSILAVSSGIKAGATGVGIGEDGMNALSSIGQKEFAGAAIGGVLLGFGIKGDLGADELDKALDDASLLDNDQAELDAGVTPDQALSKLSKDDAKQLQELVPNYKDPKAVAEATKDVNKDLAQARKVTGLVDDPKDFVKDHFVTDPASKAVSQWLDGSTGDGNGG